MTTIDAYAGIPELTVSLDGGLLTATLNRPDSLNSLNAAMLHTLADVLNHAADDPAVRVVRLGGAGRGFSSGAGISAEDQSNRRPDTPDEVLQGANRAVQAIVNLPKPVVAVVQGPTAGVGVSLALACDIVLASEKAFFLLAFTKIGLMPDGGASALVAASIGRARAMKMALLAERLSAADAFDAGLISSVYPADELEAGVAAVIDKLANGPAVALRKTKQAINAATLTELDAAIGRESEGQLILLGTNDFREGTKAFQEHRSPEFTDS
ncbi:enoyl-CoA hydratase [Mycobacterium sp. BK086]|uniref:enoyl-CoA hydratase n=1 Tax=Mycobacterium sp. BK086 TaxID=2512165 RepID=UPI00105E0D70|nr:enoyl-CoA hydratase [Mycobacterium sp. BK086]TDO09028.1 enoyl-CoA hydratase [Mycobacterium sp. BK086]